MKVSLSFVKRLTKHQQNVLTLTSIFSTCIEECGRPVCSHQDSNSPESKWTHLQCSSDWVYCGHGLSLVVPSHFSHKLYGSQRRPNGEGYVTNWFTVTAETERKKKKKTTGWRDEGLTEWEDEEIRPSKQRSGVSDDYMTAFPNPGPELTASCFTVSNISVCKELVLFSRHYRRRM